MVAIVAVGVKDVVSNLVEYYKNGQGDKLRSYKMMGCGGSQQEIHSQQRWD